MRHHRHLALLGRRRGARRGASVVAGVTLAALLFSACGASASPSPVGGGPMHISGGDGPSQTNSHYPGAIVVPAANKPNVTLTDTSGKPYNLAHATAGEVTVVYFGYTHCPDVCPINMALAGATVSRLPAKVRSQVTVVFITTDPKRDTPGVIRAWLDNFGRGSTFVGLTGTVRQIDRAEKDVGMPLSFVESNPTPTAGGYQVEHAGYLLAYSQDNRAHLEFYDNEPAPSFATSLANLVAHGFQA